MNLKKIKIVGVFFLLLCLSSCMTDSDHSILRDDNSNEKVSTSEIFADETRTNVITDVLTPETLSGTKHLELEDEARTSSIITDVQGINVLALEVLVPSSIWNEKAKVLINSDGMVIYNGVIKHVTKQELDDFTGKLVNYTKYRSYTFENPKLALEVCSKCYTARLEFTDLKMNKKYVYGIPRERSQLGFVEDMLLDELDVFLSDIGAYE